MALRFDVNLSILLTELPLLQRPQAARDAGFEAVESWWPFDDAVPADREVDAFLSAVRDAGVHLVSLNAYGGDLAAGERGIASLPGREAHRDSLDVAVALVQALGYPVRTSGDALRVLDRVGPGARLLCDVYQLSVNGEDPVEVVRRHADRIGHVQLADAPGRHQPGTGSVDVAGCLAALEEVGYAGWVGLEYHPLGPSTGSFGWLRT